MNIELKTTSSKIEKMSARRRKIALSKKSGIVLINCYPIGLTDSGIQQTSNPVEFTVGFSFKE